RQSFAPCSSRGGTTIDTRVLVATARFRGEPEIVWYIACRLLLPGGFLFAGRVGIGSDQKALPVLRVGHQRSSTRRSPPLTCQRKGGASFPKFFSSRNSAVPIPV